MVLALSVTYIPLSRLVYSLLTVALSGQIIGIVQRVGLPSGPEDACGEAGEEKAG